MFTCMSQSLIPLYSAASMQLQDKVILQVSVFLLYAFPCKAILHALSLFFSFVKAKTVIKVNVTLAVLKTTTHLFKSLLTEPLNFKHFRVKYTCPVNTN